MAAALATTVSGAAALRVGGEFRAAFHAAAGGSHVRREVSTPPLELRGPFPAESSSTSRFLLRNVTAGIFGGDRVDLDLRAHRGASVAVSPAAATRVFESRGETARLRTHLRVDDGARLDFDAGLVILQRRSDLEQEVRLEITAGATLRYSETLVVGRIAHDERLAFDRYLAALSASMDGSALYEERVMLEPARTGRAIETALGGAHALGTMLILGEPQPGSLAPALDQFPGALAGASRLPRGPGTLLRVLGRTPEAVAAVFATVRATLDGSASSEG